MADLFRQIFDTHLVLEVVGCLLADRVVVLHYLWDVERRHRPDFFGGETVTVTRFVYADARRPIAAVPNRFCFAQADVDPVVLYPSHVPHHPLDGVRFQ